MEHMHGYAVKQSVAGDIPTNITCYTLSFVAARYRPLSVPGTFLYARRISRHEKSLRKDLHPPEAPLTGTAKRYLSGSAPFSFGLLIFSQMV